MSETDGPGGEAAVANGQLPEEPGDDQAAGSGTGSSRAADGGESGSESWFRPAPADGSLSANGADGAEYYGSAAAQADWFLRTGRAGLLPDSMTESWEEGGHAELRAATAGAPPWAGDSSAPGPDAPPPWESGPWPGPGEARPESARSAARPEPSPAVADTGNWQSTAGVVSGLIPVVVPGLVLGVLGLRRARVTGTGRTASWLAIAFSAIWAVVLVIWIASAGSTAAGACGGYQNGVSYAVSQVLHDLDSGAPRSVVTADLHQAINLANTAAAGAQQVGGRNAMATLTADLQQVASEAVGSTSAGALHQQVASAEAAMVSACKA
jgi:hypothetical protein